MDYVIDIEVVRYNASSAPRETSEMDDSIFRHCYVRCMLCAK